MNAIHEAIRSVQLERVVELINAFPSMLNDSSCYEAYYGTPLHTAVRYQHDKERCTCISSFHCIVRNEKQERLEERLAIVSFLLAQKNINLSIKDYYGETAKESAMNNDALLSDPLEGAYSLF